MDISYKEATDSLIQRLYMSQRIDYIKIEKLQEEIIKLKKQISELSIELDLYKSKIITNI
jgi:hypothetical protein